MVYIFKECAIARGERRIILINVQSPRGETAFFFQNLQSPGGGGVN